MYASGQSVVYEHLVKLLSLKGKPKRVKSVSQLARIEEYHNITDIYLWLRWGTSQSVMVKLLIGVLYSTYLFLLQHAISWVLHRCRGSSRASERAGEGHQWLPHHIQAMDQCRNQGEGWPCWLGWNAAAIKVSGSHYVHAIYHITTRVHAAGGKLHSLDSYNFIFVRYASLSRAQKKLMMAKIKETQRKKAHSIMNKRTLKRMF